jgi:hypothetical protein
LKNIETGNIPKERIPNVLAEVFQTSLGIVVADYSSGKNKDDIIKDYDRTLHFLEMDWNKKNGYYVELLWLLSMAILLEIDDGKFDKLVGIIDNENYNDYIIDYFVGFRKNGRKFHDKILFKEPYGNLAELIDSSDESKIDKIKDYLNKKWYKGHKDSFWYNNHNSKHNTYFGYWSFEAGAIVKVLNLNDKDLIKCKYYPYDMVHW